MLTLPEKCWEPHAVWEVLVFFFKMRILVNNANNASTRVFFVSEKKLLRCFFNYRANLKAEDYS